MGKLKDLLQGAELEWRKLGEVAEIRNGKLVSKNFIKNNTGIYPVINSGREPLGFLNIWNTENDPIGITSRGTGVGSITWQEGRYFRGNLNYSLTIRNRGFLSYRYLYHLLLFMQSEIRGLCTYGAVPALNISDLATLPIPLPSLSVQASLVEILDKFSVLTAELEAELGLRRRQYAYYRDKLLDFSEKEVEWRKLGEVAEIRRGDSVTKKTSNAGNYPVISGGRQPAYFIDYYNREGRTITVSGSGAYAGYVMYWEEPIFVNDAFSIKFDESKVLTRYVYYFLLNIQQKIHNLKRGDGVPHVYAKDVANLLIPLPSLSVQETLVEILDKFDTLANSLELGLPREIELRRRQYEYYREQLLSFN